MRCRQALSLFRHIVVGAAIVGAILFAFLTAGLIGFFLFIGLFVAGVTAIVKFTSSRKQTPVDTT